MAAIVYSRATLLMPLTVPIQGTVTTRHYCQCRQSRQYSSRRHLKVWAESGAGPSVFSCGTRREEDQERQPQPPSASTRQGNLTVQPFPVLPSPPQWMASSRTWDIPPPKKKKRQGLLGTAYPGLCEHGRMRQHTCGVWTRKLETLRFCLPFFSTSTVHATISDSGVLAGSLHGTLLSS